MRNIVFLSADPDLAVQELYDVDVIGLPITIAHTLLCAWNLAKPGVIKPLHNIPMDGDPWLKWVMESQANYSELWNYGMDLVDEHFHRFGSRASTPFKHGSLATLDRFAGLPPIPEVDMTPMPFAVQTMRAGYKTRPGHLISFTHRETPEWLK